MRMVFTGLLGIFVALVALLAVAARWADGGSFAAILPTRTISIIAGGAFALLLAAAMWPRWCRTWMIAAAGALIAAFNAAPFSWPYRAHDVAFVSDGETLRGTVYAPIGEPVAGLVLIHGSGAETRREFAYHARALARAGIVSLAYDKRGSGASGGSAAVHYRQFASDAAAALRVLRTERSGLRVGYFGHSEGGWVAPMAASMEAPDFIIVSGATLGTPAEQVLYQSVNDTRVAHGDAAADRVHTLQQAVLAFQRTGVAAPGLDDDLRAAAQEPWFEDANLPEQVYAHADYAWWTSVMDYDPAPAWAQVQAPVLGLWGADDTRSDARASAERFERLLGARFTGKIYQGGDHMVLTWPRGERTPPPEFPPTFTADIAGWISSS